MSLILVVFHFDISGNSFNDLQFANVKLILFTLFVFHFDISGKTSSDEH